jgi:hypothetical protein
LTNPVASQYSEYSDDHPGGNAYDITNMPKAERARYEFNMRDSVDD